jgi:hypothetical protein
MIMSKTKRESALCLSEPVNRECNIMNDEGCGCIKPPNCCCKEDKCCNATDVVLKAATGGVSTFSALEPGDLGQALPVVSVTVDLEKRHDPSVLLKFTTLIGLLSPGTAQTISAAVRFIVTRSDNIGAPVNIGPTFTYEKTATTAVTDSFEFQLYENSLESGMYTYTVLLSANTVVSLPGIALINSTLSAVALLTD